MKKKVFRERYEDQVKEIILNKDRYFNFEVEKPKEEKPKKTTKKKVGK